MLQAPKATARIDSDTSADSAVQRKGGGPWEIYGEAKGGLTMRTKKKKIRSILKVDPSERLREEMAGFSVAGRYREKRHYE